MSSHKEEWVKYLQVVQEARRKQAVALRRAEEAYELAIRAADLAFAEAQEPAYVAYLAAVEKMPQNPNDETHRCCLCFDDD